MKSDGAQVERLHLANVRTAREKLLRDAASRSGFLWFLASWNFLELPASCNFCRHSQSLGATAGEIEEHAGILDKSLDCSLSKSTMPLCCKEWRCRFQHVDTKQKNKIYSDKN